MNKVKKLITSVLITVPLLFVSQVDANAAEKESIVEYAKQYVGVPYKWGGTTPSGFDCSGFLTYVFNEYDVQLPRTSADQFNQGESVKQDELVPGDLVFFTTYKPGASHAGIYVGDNQFIHASSSKGIEVTSLDASYYKSRYLGAKRYLEPEMVLDAFFSNSVKEGQVGAIYIKKKINLWERDASDNLKVSRVLNPGEIYRVYGYDDKHGGQYNLGSQLYVTNMEDFIEYKSVE
ncbi:C40 family peptidase [Cytobacillus sp. FJAT-54145]|uniref:C40 family peptidase n=1 Tax=Cytobacillus spartinae TaxID=3299023 RepID=A0ABW6KD85_9BACI